MRWSIKSHMSPETWMEKVRVSHIDQNKSVIIYIMISKCMQLPAPFACKETKI